jgi:DNA-binding MarR family transcriptional regulator
MEREKLEEMSRVMATHCLSFNIRKLERVVTRHYDSYVSASGVTAVQLPLLASIYLNPLLTLREQAELLQIDRTTLWRNLRPLIRRNLVREISKSRPARYELAPRGVAALEEAVEAWTDADDSLREALGAGITKKLETSLRAARKTLRKDR